MAESTLIQMLVAQRHRDIRAQELNVQRQPTTLNGLVRLLDAIGFVVSVLLLFAACIIGVIVGLCKGPRGQI